jgi:hypothetical protein
MDGFVVISNSVSGGMVSITDLYSSLEGYREIERERA